MFFASLAFGNSIAAGEPTDTFNGDCASLGCATTITALTFFNNNFVSGSIPLSGYTIELSGATAAVDCRSATFSDQLVPSATTGQRQYLTNSHKG